MLFLLDHATHAKLAGDKEPDAASRTADYRSAAASLTSLAQLASSDPHLTPDHARTIAGYASSAAALLLQDGLD